VIGWSDQNDTLFIGWKWLHNGWVKHGVHKSAINLFGCGGLLWDSNDISLISYARKVGACNAFHADMWVMYLGLKLAQRHGITHLQIKSDSKVWVKKHEFTCANKPYLTWRQ